MKFYMPSKKVVGPVRIIVQTTLSCYPAEYSFETLIAAVQAIGPSSIRAKEDEPFLVYGNDLSGWVRKAWFYDGRGKIIEVKSVLDVADAIIQSRPPSRFQIYRRSREQRPEDYRLVPVAGTGKRGYGSIWRYPRTFQEIRENEGVIHDPEMRDYGIKVRGSRTKAYLPTVWDDRCRGDLDHHNWKRQRKTRWK